MSFRFCKYVLKYNYYINCLLNILIIIVFIIIEKCVWFIKIDLEEFLWWFIFGMLNIRLFFIMIN